jgi:HPt (histidine-containing phosphotransfer) domain-containing protein
MTGILNLAGLHELDLKELEFEYDVKAEPAAISRLCPHCGELHRVQKHGSRSMFIRDLLTTMIGMMLNEMPCHISCLTNAFQLQNSSDFRRHAHSIKGAASAVGALALAECAAVIEHCARENLPTNISALVESLEQEFTKFRIEATTQSAAELGRIGNEEICA